MFQLPAFLKNYIELVRRTFELAIPFGRKKLGVVFLVSLLQGGFQVIGVTSVFPFFALASDPGRFRDSDYGATVLSWLPTMDDTRLLLVAGLFAIGMLLLANLLNILGEYVRNRYAQQYGHWLRLRLIEQIAARPYSDFLMENTGVLLKKVLGDVNSFANGILLNLLDTFTRVMTVLLLLVTLFLVQPQIAVAAGLGLLLFYGTFFKSLGRWRARASEALKESGRGAFVQLQQLFSGIKPVKVHRAETSFIDNYKQHSAVQARYNAVIPVIGSAPRYLIEPLALGGMVVAVLVYAGRGQDLNAILPSLSVMALAAYRLLPAMQLLYGQLNGLATSVHALDEVYDEFKVVERHDNCEAGVGSSRFPRPAALPWEHEIEIRGLTFCYAGAERAVIDDFNLVIPKNSSVGIVGQTGSGKSTLVDLILGLLVPTGGGISIDGRPLNRENRRAWRAGIGYVPQEIFLVDDTITANIAFGVPENEVDRDALLVAARAAQIHDFIENDLPKKYATVVGERGVRLSGGQRQRIGLARALYHQPQLLILDEATSALDTETEAEVVKAINDLEGSVTMLIVAHRLSTIERCRLRVDLNRAS